MQFAKGDTIGPYTVVFPHKRSAYAETYRVTDPSGKTCFLKLIFHNRLSPHQVDASGAIVELQVLRSVNHPNLCHLIDHGDIVVTGSTCSYLVFDYFSSETLAQRVLRVGALSVYEIKQVARAVLSALDYLHSQPSPIIHGEVTAQNILSGFADEGNSYKLIDFGASCFSPPSRSKPKLRNLNPFYLAPERFAGVNQPESDLYAVGALLYQLLYERLPWFIDLSGIPAEEQAERILQERDKGLTFPDIDKFELDDQLINTIAKALSHDVEGRFRTAKEMLMAIEGELAIERPTPAQAGPNGETPAKVTAQKSSGPGFSAVAGLETLKRQMYEEVIEPLRNPQEYQRYGITIPNGILLYGPPGCGKTFFAKHFAEEMGFNFMCMTPATLKSRWVNATQENIAKMFADAVEQAPTMIFIDEINELLPNRESDVHEMSRSAVNEMLAQMDRTGAHGVLVVGATNYPHQIDPAMLRAGRLERKYYLGPPDKAGRKALFTLALANRPYDFGLDYDMLADLTEGYISADIQLIVNDAARTALKQSSKITMAILRHSISQNKPSLPPQELARYEAIRAEMDGESPKESKKPSVGFKRNKD